ncbi:MAG: PTS sugar transporter subunit IIA [Gammaproteobacteria bacterium]
MSVGLLIITHNTTGKDLLKTATKIFGHCPLKVETLDVHYDSNPEQLKAEASRLIEKLDSGDGVLVLVDMYGSTPGNIATAMHREDRISVLAGLNLPMLVRIFNYAHLDLIDITDSAITGGRKSIMECKPK